jgi:superfamily II DNA or RNA helicase
MSLRIPLTLLQTQGRGFIHEMESSLSISKEKEVYPQQKKCFTAVPPEPVVIWKSWPVPENRDNSVAAMIAVPMAWGIHHFAAHLSTLRPLRGDRTTNNERITFEGKLREEQQEIFKETLTLLQKQRGCACVAVYPGGGKTITAIALAHRIGLRTLILTHRIVLMEQWKQSIETFTKHASVMIMTTEKKKKKKTSIHDDDYDTADFLIVNALNVPKWSLEYWQSLGIGTVIVDECHVMVTQIMVKALSMLFPRYLLGLSATPYRPDGLSVILQHYFGKDKIVRQLYRPHHVFCVQSDFVAPDERDRQGQRLWNPVLEFQASNMARNEALVGFCTQPAFQERSILVLCKRTEHIRLLKRLWMVATGRVDEIETFYGNQTTFCPDKRVLIASFQKVGVGFSHNRLDMLVLACDCEEYFLQYLGRVFRRPDVHPVIVDWVDQHPVLKRHFQTRKRMYLTCGGTMKIQNKNDLNVVLATSNKTISSWARIPNIS